MNNKTYTRLKPFDDPVCVPPGKKIPNLESVAYMRSHFPEASHHFYKGSEAIHW